MYNEAINSNQRVVMSTLLRFVIIVITFLLAGLAILAVGGALSSEELRDNALKIVEIAGIVLVASAIVMFVTKK